MGQKEGSRSTEGVRRKKKKGKNKHATRRADGSGPTSPSQDFSCRMRSSRQNFRSFAKLKEVRLRFCPGFFFHCRPSVASAIVFFVHRLGAFPGSVQPPRARIPPSLGLCLVSHSFPFPLSRVTKALPRPRLSPLAIRTLAPLFPAISPPVIPPNDRI